MEIRKIGDKRKYSFVDHDCLGRKCFAPGMFQHRSMMAGGMTRAYHGCPDGPVGREGIPCGCPGMPHEFHIREGLPEVFEDLLKKRKAEGWITV